jgi:hypothetical protein
MKSNTKSKKSAIAMAEEKIQEVLYQLEKDHGVRAFRIAILSDIGDEPEVDLVVDERGVK